MHAMFFCWASNLARYLLRWTADLVKLYYEMRQKGKPAFACIATNPYRLHVDSHLDRALGV